LRYYRGVRARRLFRDGHDDGTGVVAVDTTKGGQVMQFLSDSARSTIRLLAAGALISAVLAPAGVAGAAARTKSRHGRHGTTHRHTPQPGHGSPGGATVSSVPWGSVNGTPVQLFTLSNARGMTVKITNYGGVVQSIWVPDRRGNLTDVALGFPTLSDYVNDFTQGANSTSWPLPGGSGNTYFGAIIGRYANRIANASFTLNNTTYKLDANNGTNTLHGGYLGWNTDVWSATPASSGGSASLTLTATMPGGEGCLASLSPGCTGFPAAVKATVVYTLTPGNELRISYQATNEDPHLATVVNLTNHTYFNLGGEGSGTVYHQLLALNSNAYTPVNTNLIPEAPYFVPVAGTAYDFRTLHPIGQYIRDTNLPDGTTGPFKQLQIAHGYDNNWVLNGYPGYRLAAVAEDRRTGIGLSAFTDQPGVQVYTGNFLVGDLIGTGGRTYRQGDAFTLETQHYPDSPHHIGQAGWPSVVLGPGSTFTSRTAFRFDTARAGFGRRAHFR
jgi:aldose 1-epimerase